MASLSPVTPHPSLSRPLPQMREPRLLHTLKQQDNSILSLIADKTQIFSGGQSHDISVWDKTGFTLKATLSGHTGSVLCLEHAPEKKWLFSGSGDSTVRIWCTSTLVALYIINPYMESDAGDIFSLGWSASLQTLYFGCQNTSLQWTDCSRLASSVTSRSNATTTTTSGGRKTPSRLPSLITDAGATTPPLSGGRKAHKFFDSYPQYERKTPDLNASNPGTGNSLSFQVPINRAPSMDNYADFVLPPMPDRVIQVPAAHATNSAHYGYIYCMAFIPSTRDGTDDVPNANGAGRSAMLVTGSGDESFKVWTCTPNGPNLLCTHDCLDGAVLSLATRRETIFAGLQGGTVVVWDLETKTLVRTIIVEENVDVLALSMLHSDLYTCTADGTVSCWSAAFDCKGKWKAHDGIILSSVLTLSFPSRQFSLVTGGNDGHIKVWSVEPSQPEANGHLDESMVSPADADSMNETMTYALWKFVSMPSISSRPNHREDCRQTAFWLKKCLSQLGAETTLLPTGEGVNPLVLATFHGTQTVARKPRILFYGHYDVVDAHASAWESEPFTLTGRNGYLYGRGVTDNKGPILAVACSAAELLLRRELGVDLVMLVEGEEEVGSTGFVETVRKHKDALGPIDAIVVSNSTWIADDPPCITYGLRGVVHCTVEVSSQRPDMHSGIEGGAVVEPMLDMINILSKLIGQDRRALVPNFYDHVRPSNDEEMQLYQKLSAIVQRPASSLSSRWREPAMTVHSVESSGSRGGNSSIIPSSVKAQVSVRIVPDQDLDTIAASLVDHIQSSFRSSKSPNKLQVDITRKADWWLGNLDDSWFKALEGAIRDEWGVEPLRIREGGSIPSIPFLEKELGCQALHLPLGQSSDQAHLPNERMSLINLFKGKSVIERFLRVAASLGSA